MYAPTLAIISPAPLTPHRTTHACIHGSTSDTEQGRHANQITLIPAATNLHLCTCA